MIKNIIELKDKVILVTGGAGFIGSNICEYLLSIGSIVRCLDNFSTGHMNNIKGLIENKNFELSIQIGLSRMSVVSESVVSASDLKAVDNDSKTDICPLQSEPESMPDLVWRMRPRI